MNLEQGMRSMLGLYHEASLDDLDADGRPRLESVPETVVGGDLESMRDLRSAKTEAPGLGRGVSSETVADASEERPRKRKDRTGLRQLALCADGKHDSLEAKQVQCTALTLLSAAALFSDEGHAQVLTALDSLTLTPTLATLTLLSNPSPHPNPNPNPTPNPTNAQVLTALDSLKHTRRRLHRFGWLVEACNRYQQSEDGDDERGRGAAPSGVRGRARSTRGVSMAGGTRDYALSYQVRLPSPALAGLS